MPDPAFHALRILWWTWRAGGRLASPWTARTVARDSARARLAHGLLWLAGAILLLARHESFGILLTPLFPPAAAIAWTGVALAGVGFAYTWWARLHLGRFWSGAVTLKADHVLVRDGPYAWTRHPIYTGLLLAFVGTALQRDTLGALLGLALLVAGVLVKARQEE